MLRALTPSVMVFGDNYFVMLIKINESISMSPSSDGIGALLRRGSRRGKTPYHSLSPLAHTEEWPNEDTTVGGSLQARKRALT